MIRKHANALIILAIALAYFVANPGSVRLPGIIVLAIVAVGYIAVVTFRQRDQNPFEAMTQDERERAVAYVRANSRKTLRSSDGDWMLALLKKYAANLSSNEQAEHFNKFFERHKHLLAKKVERRGHVHDGPALVFARKRRVLGFDVTRDGTSWLGGLPALGGQAWPRALNGKLLTPVAQVDLSEVGAQIQIPGLPNTGALAFFASISDDGTVEGAVCHVDPAEGAKTEPPEPLPPVKDYTFGGPLRRGEPGQGQDLFPRMSIEMTKVVSYVGDGKDEEEAQIARAFGTATSTFLRAENFPDCIPGGSQPFNRDSLLRFVHGARISLGSFEKMRGKLRRMCNQRQGSLADVETQLQELESNAAEDAAGQTVQEKLAGLRQQVNYWQSLLDRVMTYEANFDNTLAALSPNLEALRSWGEDGNRWSALSKADQSEIAPLLRPWIEHEGFGHLLLELTEDIHRNISDCVTETLRVMAVSKDAVFAAMPQAVKDALDGPHRQPRSGTHHKMFGEPDCIQTAALENEDCFLLLQLQCDDIAGFHWGDAGVLQFWIRPEDLEAERWELARMTFEGH
jgi:Domain of unknown function (DUF1963)